MATSLLLSLCPELRNRIYEFVVCQEKPITIQDVNDDPEYDDEVSKLSSNCTVAYPNALTRTCKAIHKEARTMFYFLNTFTFTCDHARCDFLFRYTISTVDLFLQQIGSRNQAALRSVRFENSTYKARFTKIPAFAFLELVRLSRRNPQITDFQCVATFLMVDSLEGRKEQMLELSFDMRSLAASLRNVIKEFLDCRQELPEQFCNDEELLLARKYRVGLALESAMVDWPAEMWDESVAGSRVAEADAEAS
ncbi:hypothetical protein LTR17_002328 [Elasticomyces elasticus]|nr:hypothetical protein LTR17_002328 [Elasticomyces elasticus]